MSMLKMLRSRIFFVILFFFNYLKLFFKFISYEIVFKNIIKWKVFKFIKEKKCLEVKDKRSERVNN